MRNLDNLRAFLQKEPFNLTKAAELMEINPKVLSDFINKQYTTKSGFKYCGLGNHEETVFTFFTRLGYSDEKTWFEPEPNVGKTVFTTILPAALIKEQFGNRRMIEICERQIPEDEDPLIDSWQRRCQATTLEEVVELISKYTGCTYNEVRHRGLFLAPNQWERHLKEIIPARVEPIPDEPKANELLASFYSSGDTLEWIAENHGISVEEVKRRVATVSELS